MLTVAKVGLPLLGVVIVAGIVVVALSSRAGEGSGLEAGAASALASPAEIPAIDARAPAQTKTATFALG